MQIFWKVHISNFNCFVRYLYHKYGKFCNTSGIEFFINYYKHSGLDYIYLCIDDDFSAVENVYHLSYSTNFLNTDKWKYMGEYHGRKDKLIKLDKLSKK
jgi:hypothetical protein